MSEEKLTSLETNRVLYGSPLIFGSLYGFPTEDQVFRVLFRIYYYPHYPHQNSKEFFDDDDL